MTLRRVTAAALFLALALLAGAGWIWYQNISDLLLANRRVRHIFAVREQLNTMLTLLTDAETETRGYIITGDAAHLHSYAAARPLLDHTIGQLRTLTAGRPEQQRRLDALVPLITARLASLKQEIDIRSTQGFEATAQQMQTGRHLMEAIRTALTQMKAAEGEMLIGQEQESRESGSAMRVAFAIVVLLGFSILVLVFYLLNREIADRSRTERKFRSLLEAAPDALVIVDKDGKMVLVNSQTRRLFGYAPQELLGRSVDVLVPERFRHVHPQHRVGYFAAPLPRPMGAGVELYALRKDGSEFPVEISLSPLETAEGLLVTTAVRDVTKRKRAEEELHRRQTELAHVLRVSTIGEMTVGLAHEINQPLSAIVSYAKGCVRRMRATPGQSPELLAAIEEIAAQAVRADQIVRRLREFVRKHELQYERVDLNKVVREAIQLVEGDARERRTALRLDLAADIPPVQVDRIQVEQVILNLIRNGLEAMQDSDLGARRLTIETSVADHNTVEVAIRDTGKGLATADAEKVFEPFFTTKAHGLGMGLSISRSIIEAHGGRLWATPNPDRGVTFRFTVPLSVGDAADAG